MFACRKNYLIASLLLALSTNECVDAFAQPRSRLSHQSATTLGAEGFGRSAVKERPKKDATKSVPIVDGNSSTENLSADDAKTALIDLIPRMTGKDEEYREVESHVNLLEEKYVPVQTIDFLNLAMTGEWQLLFSTNLLGRPNRKLRLREMIQKVESDGFNGSLINMAQWDYAEDEEEFDSTGNFNVKCTYKINQGARMVVDLNDHELRPAKGSKIPSDVPGLVGLLHRAIPKEIFDPSGHAMDTTYLDADLRIVRLTGPNHEGVRNIFMRKGSFGINPVN